MILLFIGQDHSFRQLYYMPLSYDKIVVQYRYSPNSHAQYSSLWVMALVSLDHGIAIRVSKQNRHLNSKVAAFLMSEAIEEIGDDFITFG